jgi:hypothetical protein
MISSLVRPTDTRLSSSKPTVHERICTVELLPVISLGENRIFGAPPPTEMSNASTPSSVANIIFFCPFWAR